MRCRTLLYLMTGILLVAGITPVMATTVKISKTYAQGYVLDGDGSYHASSPLYIDDALGAGGLNQAVNEVIIMDSGTYEIAADYALDNATRSFAGMMFFGAGALPYSGAAGGITIRAAEGATPTIDVSNLPGGDSWGRDGVLLYNYGAPANAPLLFKGIRFLSNTNYNATTGGYTSGMIVDVPTGPGNATTQFEDCIFEVKHPVYILNGAGGTGTIVEPLFKHCAFRMLDGQTYRRNLVYVVPSTVANPTAYLKAEQCTFIGGPTDNDWSVFWGDYANHSFVRCILYLMEGPVRYAAPNSFVDNVFWQIKAPGTIPNPLPAGNEQADPLFVDPLSSFMITEGSPAANYGVNNIGYDMITLPAELTSFTTE